MKKEYLYVLITAVIVGGVAFWGGMQSQKNQRSAQFTAVRNGNGFQRGNNQGGNRQGRMQVGDIVSVTNNTMTVKYPDGSSKIIILPSSASISKASQGSISDLQTGTKVLVFGTNNSDGTETAQNIQINPPTQGFGGNRPDGNNQPNPSTQPANQ